MMTSCDHVREQAIDALTGRTAWPSAVDEHIATCDQCRPELAGLRALWGSLGELPTPTPRRDSAERIAAALGSRNAGLQTETGTVRTSWLMAALLGGLLIGGATAAMITARRSAPLEHADSQTYLLLLHESNTPDPPPSAEQLRALVAEYSAWANQLRDRGQLVIAEKLMDDAGRWLTPSGPALVDRADHVSGFFMIRAKDYDEAMRVARSSPHLKYGGTIEIRGIEDTSSQ